jgi:hypothetical protein
MSSPPTCGTCDGSGNHPAGYGAGCDECARREGRAEGLREALAAIDCLLNDDATHCRSEEVIDVAVGEMQDAEASGMRSARDCVEALLSPAAGGSAGC